MSCKFYPMKDKNLYFIPEEKWIAFQKFVTSQYSLILQYEYYKKHKREDSKYKTRKERKQQLEKINKRITKLHQEIQIRYQKLLDSFKLTMAENLIKEYNGNIREAIDSLSPRDQKEKYQFKVICIGRTNKNYYFRVQVIFHDNSKLQALFEIFRGIPLNPPGFKRVKEEFAFPPPSKEPLNVNQEEIQQYLLQCYSVYHGLYDFVKKIDNPEWREKIYQEIRKRKPDDDLLDEDDIIDGE